MAFKDYSSPQPDKWVTVGGRTNDGKPNPTTIEGYYLGRQEGPDRFNPGKTKITYMLQTSKGVYGVNGSSNLNKRMLESELNIKKEGHSVYGMKVVITFIGTSPSNKGNPLKLFNVKFDADDKVEVTRMTNTATMSLEEESDDTSSYDEESSYEAEDQLPEQDEDALQAPALAAEERRAKVRALLGKGKKAN